MLMQPPRPDAAASGPGPPAQTGTICPARHKRHRRFVLLLHRDLRLRNVVTRRPAQDQTGLGRNALASPQGGRSISYRS